MLDIRLPLITCLLLTTLTLSACAPYRPGSKHAAMCNQLNSQMIFTGIGSTSNTRQANIQAAEKPNVVRTYDKDNCGY